MTTENTVTNETNEQKTNDEKIYQKCKEYIAQIKVFFVTQDHEDYRKIIIPYSYNENEQNLIEDYLKVNLKVHEWLNCSHDLVLHQLLEQNKSEMFRLLLTTNHLKYIPIDVNVIDESNRTLFIYFADSYLKDKSPVSSYYLGYFFDKGYKIRPQDEDYLIKLYKETDLNDAQQEKWVILRIFNKLQNKESFQELAIMRPLNKIKTIISFKIKNNFGFGYAENANNLLKIANNCFTHYKDNGIFLLNALNHYGAWDNIVEYDKKRTFRNLVAELKSTPPPQDHEFEEFAIKLFPELKDCVSPRTETNLEQERFDADDHDE